VSEFHTCGFVGKPPGMLKEDVDGSEIEYVNSRDVLRAVAPFWQLAHATSVKSCGCGFAEG